MPDKEQETKDSIRAIIASPELKCGELSCVEFSLQNAPQSTSVIMRVPNTGVSTVLSRLSRMLELSCMVEKIITQSLSTPDVYVTYGSVATNAFSTTGQLAFFISIKE